MLFNTNLFSPPLQSFKTKTDLEGDKLFEVHSLFTYQPHPNLKSLEFELRVHKENGLNKSILVPKNFNKKDKEQLNLVLPLADKITQKTKFSLFSAPEENYWVYIAPEINYSQKGVMTFMPTFTDFYIIESDKGMSYHMDTLGELSEKDFFYVLRTTSSLQSLYDEFSAVAQRKKLLNQVPQNNKNSTDKNTEPSFKI